MIDKESYVELKKAIQDARQDLATLNNNLNELQNMAVRANSTEEFAQWLEKADLEKGLKYISVWDGK